MDGDELFGRFLQQLRDLLETGEEIARRREGTGPSFATKKTAARGTPDLSRALARAAKSFCQNGVARVEIDRRRPDRSGRFRVAIAGLIPMWMTVEQAALFHALAEPVGDTKDRFVSFKTIAQLHVRVEELTHKPIQERSLFSSISRLKREVLPYPELIRKRETETRGEIPAYRFLLLANGEFIEHRPDGGAIDGATAVDR